MESKKSVASLPIYSIKKFNPTTTPISSPENQSFDSGKSPILFPTNLPTRKQLNEHGKVTNAKLKLYNGNYILNIRNFIDK